MTRYTLALICTVLMLLSACSSKLDSPDNAFLDSTLILRPGIADAGDMTVRQFVSHLASLPQPDGTPAKIGGWTQTDQGYTLHIKVAGEFQVPFAWSKSEKVALLQYAEMEGERVPGMQFFMLTIGMKPVSGNKAALTVPAAGAEPAAASAIPETQRPAEIPAPTPTAPAVPAQPLASPAPAVATPAPRNTAPAAAPVAPPANITTAAPAVTVPHLCTAAETPIFACSTGKKRVSVCTGRSDSNELLAYRIAPLEGAVEMEYPSGGAGAASAFQRGSQAVQDSTAVNFLSFDKGNYRYVVYAGGGENGRKGVMVEQIGKRIADLRCQSDAMSRFDSVQLQKMGLSLDSRTLPLQ